jgi:large subunit ribosomal protein L18e
MTMKKDLMNIEKKGIIDLLYATSKQKKKEIYVRVAELINVSRRRENKVNLSKLQTLDVVKDGAIVIVPGKVLGSGILNKKITIYANSVSESTKLKYKGIKSIKDFCKDSIDYKKAIIIK